MSEELGFNLDYFLYDIHMVEMQYAIYINGNFYSINNLSMYIFTFT